MVPVAGGYHHSYQGSLDKFTQGNRITVEAPRTIPGRAAHLDLEADDRRNAKKTTSSSAAETWLGVGIVVADIAYATAATAAHGKDSSLEATSQFGKQKASFVIC